MTVAERQDPLPVFNFRVKLFDRNGEPGTVASFSECSGLDAELEVENYKEGGVNDRVYRFPSRFKFSNIILKRGMTQDPVLREWHLNLLRGSTQRRDGLIILLNEAQEEVLAWKFERGLPVKWTGPTLNAKQSEVSIETLEISHEHLEPFDLGRS